jgi:Carbohydrate family 9 binding domain-like
MSKTMVTFIVLMCCAAGGCVQQQAVLGTGTKIDPVQIPHAVEEITVDGDLSEWDAIGTLTMDKTREPASTFRFCWNAKGLYGSAVIRDQNIVVNTTHLHKGDCMEVWVEKDFGRSGDRSEHSTQYLITVDPKGKPGKAWTISQTGGVAGGNESRLPKAVRDKLWKDAGLESAWKKIDGGYTLEFLIPAAELRPAKMEDGTKIGFNCALDDDGKSAEWFYNSHITGCWHRPTKWAAAKLVK